MDRPLQSRETLEEAARSKLKALIEAMWQDQHIDWTQLYDWEAEMLVELLQEEHQRCIAEGKLVEAGVPNTALLEGKRVADEDEFRRPQEDD